MATGKDRCGSEGGGEGGGEVGSGGSGERPRSTESSETESIGDDCMR